MIQSRLGSTLFIAPRRSRSMVCAAVHAAAAGQHGAVARGFLTQNRKLTYLDVDGVWYWRLLIFGMSQSRLLTRLGAGLVTELCDW